MTHRDPYDDGPPAPVGVKLLSERIDPADSQPIEQRFILHGDLVDPILLTFHEDGDTEVKIVGWKENVSIHLNHFQIRELSERALEWLQRVEAFEAIQAGEREIALDRETARTYAQWLHYQEQAAEGYVYVISTPDSLIKLCFESWSEAAKVLSDEWNRSQDAIPF